MSGASASKSKSRTQTRVFDPESLSGIIGQLGQFAGRETQGLGALQLGEGDTQIQTGVSPQLQQLQAGGLTSQEQSGIEQQLAAIEAGGLGAEQRISQTVRSQAEARGLGSSRGAIAQEAAQLANIPLAQAQQRADVFGQAGQLQRQGLLGGAQIGLQREQLGLQERGQLGQLALQERGQRLGFGQQQQENLLRALLGAGGLAGMQQQTGRSSSSQVGFG